MYELFTLGQLMDRPMHGYLLHQIISVAIGPLRQMSWGALYPLVRRLEREGLIGQHEQQADQGGHQRKMYAITEAGRARFRQLMLVPGVYNADYPDTFNIKFCNFHNIATGEQLLVLEHYRVFLGWQRDYFQAQRQRIAAHAEISESKRPQILRVLEHRQRLLEADTVWVEQEITQRMATCAEYART